MKLKNVIAMLMITISSSLQAQELIIHTGSIHVSGNSNKYNNVNPGVGYRKDNITYGLYYNSYDNVTIYASKEWMLTNNFGGWLAIASGYDKAVGKPITIIGGIIIKIPLTHSISTNILLTPKFGDNPFVTHLALSYKL